MKYFEYFQFYFKILIGIAKFLLINISDITKTYNQMHYSLSDK